MSSARLERYRLRLRQMSRAQLPGAHQVRRRGQSLEFREFRPYNPGDDIRHVDWRASTRHGRADDYLVRAFEHEAETRIVISLDTRESMHLPAVAPKLQVACWLGEALAYVAGRSGDAVTVQALFSSGAARAVDLGRVTNRPYIRHALRRVAVEPPHAVLELKPAARLLPPAGIWLLVTDLYFDREADIDALVRQMRAAQRGARWVIVVELDSWPHEKGLLGTGRRRIDGPGVAHDGPRVDVTDELMRSVEASVERIRARFDAAQAGGYSRLRWTWPAEATPDVSAMFRHHFFSDGVLRRLLMKDGLS